MLDRMAPYSPAQLLRARAALPHRGRLCHACGLRVPELVLERRDLRRIIRLINEGRPNMALAELRSATSCPERWGRLWILHKGRPGALRPGPQCRRCRMHLRSSRRLRCTICGTDCGDDPAFDPERLRVRIDRRAKCYPS